MLVAPLFTTITGFIKASYCSLVDCSCKWSLQQINLAKLVESSGAYLVHLAPHRLRLQILTMTAVNSSTAQWSVCCLHTSSGHDKNLDAESLNCQPPLLFFFFFIFPCSRAREVHRPQPDQCFTAKLCLNICFPCEAYSYTQRDDLARRRHLSANSGKIIIAASMK